jgi:hypothetical protein
VPFLPIVGYRYHCTVVDFNSAYSSWFFRAFSRFMLISGFSVLRNAVLKHEFLATFFVKIILFLSYVLVVKSRQTFLLFCQYWLYHSGVFITSAFWKVS